MNIKVLKAIFLLAFFGLAACSSEPDFAVDDPQNCEEMKEIPEMYDRCVDELTN